MQTNAFAVLASRSSSLHRMVDTLSTMVIDGTQVKVYAWYDGEWGYMNCMMELTGKVAQSL